MLSNCLTCFCSVVCRVETLPANHFKQNAWPPTLLPLSVPETFQIQREAAVLAVMHFVGSPELYDDAAALKRRQRLSGSRAREGTLVLLVGGPEGSHTSLFSFLCSQPSGYVTLSVDSSSRFLFSCVDSADAGSAHARHCLITPKGESFSLTTYWSKSNLSSR